MIAKERLLLAVAWLVAGLPDAGADSWNQFRGPA